MNHSSFEFLLFCLFLLATLPAVGRIGIPKMMALMALLTQFDVALCDSIDEAGWRMASQGGGRLNFLVWPSRLGEEELYSHDHLLASQKRVADELASSQGDGGLGVSHVDDRARCLC